MGGKNAKLILLKINSLSTDGNTIKPVLPCLLLTTPLPYELSLIEMGGKNAKLILLKIYSLSTDGNTMKPVLPGHLLATPLPSHLLLIYFKD